MERTKTYRQTAIEALLHIYQEQEAAGIVNLLIESRIGKASLREDKMLTPEEHAVLEADKQRLLHAEPVQYVLGKTWFYDLVLEVGPGVLIPRPETEELAAWILEDWKGRSPGIVDIGTGSGAIALMLSKHLHNADVWAADVSEDALRIASVNANKNGLDIRFMLLDILNPHSWSQLPEVDVVVSNPPYIPQSEKGSMHNNVKLWEPEIALFVPDEDPLVFYKAIIHASDSCLKEGGAVYLETHENYHGKLADWAASEGWTKIESRHDMQGKHRMLKLQK